MYASFGLNELIFLPGLLTKTNIVNDENIPSIVWIQFHLLGHISASHITHSYARYMAVIYIITQKIFHKTRLNKLSERKSGLPTLSQRSDELEIILIFIQAEFL